MRTARSRVSRMSALLGCLALAGGAWSDQAPTKEGIARMAAPGATDTPPAGPAQR